MKQIKSFAMIILISMTGLLMLACENPAGSDAGSDVVDDVSDNAAGESSEDSGSGSFSITYDANGYTGSSAPVDSTTYSSGDTAVILRMETQFYNLYEDDDFVGVNHFFGWNTQADGEGSTYHPDRSLTVNGNITLYARWSTEARQFLRFGPAGGAWPPPSDGNQYMVGDTVPLPSGDIVDTPEGHEFVQWEQFGSDTTYEAGEIFSVTASSNTNIFLPEFRKLSYTVTVDLQGGSWTGEDLGTVFEDVEYDSSLSGIGLSTPEKEGHNFVYWEMYFPEEDDGYWDNIQLETQKMPGRDVELRVVWEIVL
ncbi:InlB B-repeat-containing protein [Spirochaeta dissipatitropha]